MPMSMRTRAWSVCYLALSLVGCSGPAENTNPDPSATVPVAPPPGPSGVTPVTPGPTTPATVARYPGREASAASGAGLVYD